MPSIGFKLSQPEKDMINSTIESYQERSPKKLNKSQALVALVQDFIKYQTEGTGDTDYFPPNVYDVLTAIRGDCEYLHFIEQDFACYEDAHKKHAPQVLEGTPEQVQILCKLCLAGKRRLEIERSKRLQEKEYIRRLATFAKGLINITEKGIVHDVFFCLREILDGNLGFSRDNQTIFCPFEDGDIVYIDETCRERINPKDGSTPCQFLSSMQNIVRLDKEFWKSTNLDLPELGLDLDGDTPDPETEITPEPELDLEPDRKTIEVDGKEIDDDTKEIEE